MEPRAGFRVLKFEALQRQENLIFGWAIGSLVIALVAGDFGVVAGILFAAAKSVFVVALIAFLSSSTVGLTQRELP